MMSNRLKNSLRAFSLGVLLISFIPIHQAARAAPAIPPVDMFQLPWEQGLAWVALDGFDDGSNRLSGSPHNHLNGGAVDFAPRATMFKGEDTSNFWVTAAADGTIVEISKCHIKIAHAGGWVTEYQHLANLQVQLGDAVTRNQRLAIIANALSQPVCPGSEPPDIPHLHFVLRPNMVGATFAGWEFRYNSFWNNTTFRKDGKTVGLFKPLLNVMAQPAPTPTIPPTSTPDSSQATATPPGGLPTNTPDLFATSTPTPFDQITQTPDLFSTFTPTPFGQFTDTPDPFATATPTPFGQVTNTPNPFASATPTLIDQFTNTPDSFVSATPTPFDQFTNTPDSFASATPTLFGQFTNTPDLLASATPTPFGQFTNTPDSIASATPTVSGQVTDTPIPFASATTTPLGQFTNTPDLFATATPTLPDQFTSTPDQFVTATPTFIAQATNTPSPFATPTQTPTVLGGPFVSTTVDPAILIVGETALARVRLHNVPAAGYASAEFTCTINPALVEASNIVVMSLFGTDAVTIINAPRAGNFIVAISGAKGSKATADGVVFTFNVRALQAGQTTIDCTARVSSGNQTLTPLPSSAAVLTILELTPTPTNTPIPVFTATPTSPVEDWFTFTNLAYGFEFKYPPQGVIADGRTDNFARLDLPFVQGTNLREKYLEVIVVENLSVCRSPLATQSMLDSSETVVINGIPFLKETGGDGAAGNLYQWVAYSTPRGNACISLDFILHSLNPGNFPTPPPVFDYAGETAVFGQIVETFSWLALPTPTPSEQQTATPVGSPFATFTPVASPTSTVVPFGMLAGQVLASKPVTISLYNQDSILAASIPVNPDGTFLFTVSPGAYTLTASASGHLSAQASVTVTGGGTATLPTIDLPAGDIDNNGVIDQFDAMTVGMSYNTAIPAAADLNNDGIINVLDLEILARNYRKTGPVVWQ